MASLRNALRLTSRTPLTRTTPATTTIASRILPMTAQRRGYMFQKIAAPEKSAEDAEQASEDSMEDPNMNGNYPDPNLTSALPVKRQFRDPYAKWWDPQERRNYGEPVHEDNDILGIFSTESYTHFTPGWGGVLVGTFIGAVLGLCAVVAQLYPDKPSVARTFPGGLERELGGPRAPRAHMSEDDPAAYIEGGPRSTL